MTYQGHALNSSLERGRQSGVICIDSSYITFTYENDTVALPLDNLEITLGGSGNRLVYFKSLAQPDWVFYSSDSSIINDAHLSHDRACAECIKLIKKKKLVNVSSIFIFLICSAIFFVGAYYCVKEAADLAAQNVPPKYETEVGVKLFKLVTMDKKIIESPELMSSLSQITDPLVNAVENKEHTFIFHLVEDSTLNAFALPGGHVVINSGLLLQADSPEEVAGVLAHEISHVTKRHHIRGLVNQVGIVLVVQTIFGDASALVATISRFGSDLSQLKNSREFEIEADNSGWDLLRRAEINPLGMISFFEKLKGDKSELEEGVESSIGFMSTHPATDDRISALNKRWEHEKDQIRFTEIDIQFEDFKKELRAVLNKE